MISLDPSILLGTRLDEFLSLAALGILICRQFQSHEIDKYNWLLLGDQSFMIRYSQRILWEQKSGYEVSLAKTVRSSQDREEIKMNLDLADESHGRLALAAV